MVQGLYQLRSCSDCRDEGKKGGRGGEERGGEGNGRGGKWEGRERGVGVGDMKGAGGR